MKDLFDKKIRALIPIYTKDGANFTLIKFLNKEDLILKKTIYASLRSLCEYYHLDLKSSKRTCHMLLGVKKTPPIVIKDDLVLIAVKTRTPIGKDDGAYSYINIEMIKTIKDQKIYFKDEESLPVKSTAKTIEKNIKQAKLLKDIIKNRDMVREDENFYMERETLKKDLEIIYSKLSKIEKTIFK